MKKLLSLIFIAITVQSQAQNVGVGNPNPAEKLDVTGNINVTGTIKANGVDGTARQVLAKNATNNLAWVNTSHSNNTRFKCIFSNSRSELNNVPDFYTVYNLNTTNINISGTTITINKSGLYHFDVQFQANAASDDNPIQYPFVFIDIVITNTPPHDESIIYRGPLTPIINSNNFWTYSTNRSFEQYIPAPSVISIRANSLNTNTLEVYGTVNGHLISE
jgi:hypothetical protein